MAHPVKWFSEAMGGAPLLSTDTGNGTAGTLISVLKACLVTGFNINPIQSITLNGGLAVATFALAHGFLPDSIVAIEGVNLNWNGEYRVLSVTTTTVTFAPVGTPSAVGAGGTMKVAPAGWELEFVDGTNTVAVFKRLAADATALRLRIDNSAFSGWNGTATYRYYYAKAQMVENVTDVNTYTLVKEFAWPASHAYATGEQQWDLVADDKLFYFLPRYSTTKMAAVLMFGDINSIRPNDNYHCVLTGILTPAQSTAYHWGARLASTTGYPIFNDVLQFGSLVGAVGASSNIAFINRRSLFAIARMHHQLPGSDNCLLLGIGYTFGCPYQAGVGYPNATDSGVYFNDGKIPIVEQTAQSIRGFLPGVLSPLQNDLRLWRYNIAHDPAKPGSLLRILKAAGAMDLSATAGSTESGSGTSYTEYRNTERLIGFDIAGPWR
ncbi:hypothetical protein [Aeromonas caviae]|uniref:hypothetical protein n=1 Tax=Aeromonas caviae TaxID=648 RepID=UPI002B24BF71|nr:hypothetical protein [Aeromonas caviae]MEA9416891.1 hypothetical protein [Aeromonas caviae]